MKKETHLNTMLLPPMVNELILPIKPVVAIPMTTRVKAMKDALTDEMLFEMTG